MSIWSCRLECQYPTHWPSVTAGQSAPVDKRAIIRCIVDLWRQYRFLRYINKQVKQDRNREYLQILNAYREKRHLSEERISDLWEEAFDSDYVMIMAGSRLRIKAKGKDLIEFGLYGFVKTLVNQHLAPVTWLAAVVAIADFMYRLAHHHWKFWC